MPGTWQYSKNNSSFYLKSAVLFNSGFVMGYTEIIISYSSFLYLLSSLNISHLKKKKTKTTIKVYIKGEKFKKLLSLSYLEYVNTRLLSIVVNSTSCFVCKNNTVPALLTSNSLLGLGTGCPHILLLPTLGSCRWFGLPPLFWTLNFVRAFTIFRSCISIYL